MSNLKIPYGYCHCGCGQKTNISNVNDRHNNLTIGKPLKYLKNHRRTPPRSFEESISVFWSSVIVTADDNKCWEWSGIKDYDGYGIIKIGNIYKAHRFAWSYPDYIIPPKMLICHSCDNPSCCNPKHLFLGTLRDNSDDKVQKGRNPRGESHGMHKLSADQVIEIRLRYAEGNVSSLELGNEYGVHRKTIIAIVKRRAWKHI